MLFLCVVSLVRISLIHMFTRPCSLFPHPHIRSGDFRTWWQALDSTSSSATCSARRAASRSHAARRRQAAAHSPPATPPPRLAQPTQIATPHRAGGGSRLFGTFRSGELTPAMRPAVRIGDGGLKKRQRTTCATGWPGTRANSEPPRACRRRRPSPTCTVGEDVREGVRGAFGVRGAPARGALAEAPRDLGAGARQRPAPAHELPSPSSGAAPRRAAGGRVAVCSARSEAHAVVDSCRHSGRAPRRSTSSAGSAPRPPRGRVVHPPSRVGARRRRGSPRRHALERTQAALASARLTKAHAGLEARKPRCARKRGLRAAARAGGAARRRAAQHGGGGVRRRWRRRRRSGRGYSRWRRRRSRTRRSASPR